MGVIPFRIEKRAGPASANQGGARKRALRLPSAIIPQSPSSCDRDGFVSKPKGPGPPRGVHVYPPKPSSGPSGTYFAFHRAFRASSNDLEVGCLQADPDARPHAARGSPAEDRQRSIARSRVHDKRSRSIRLRQLANIAGARSSPISGLFGARPRFKLLRPPGPYSEGKLRAGSIRASSGKCLSGAFRAAGGDRKGDHVEPIERGSSRKLPPADLVCPRFLFGGGRWTRGHRLARSLPGGRTGFESAVLRALAITLGPACSSSCLPTSSRKEAWPPVSLLGNFSGSVVFRERPVKGTLGRGPETTRFRSVSSGNSPRSLTLDETRAPRPRWLRAWDGRRAISFPCRSPLSP